MIYPSPTTQSIIETGRSRSRGRTKSPEGWACRPAVPVTDQGFLLRRPEPWFIKFFPQFIFGVFSLPRKKFWENGFFFLSVKNWINFGKICGRIHQNFGISKIWEKKKRSKILLYKIGITLLSIKRKIIIPPQKKGKLKNYKARCDFLFWFWFSPPILWYWKEMVSFFPEKISTNKK